MFSEERINARLFSIGNYFRYPSDLLDLILIPALNKKKKEREELEIGQHCEFP